MSRRSFSQRLRDVREIVAGTERYHDMALMLVRAEKPSETLLIAGGRWDKIDRRFVPDQEVDRCAVIRLAESQVPFTKWFAAELADYAAGYQRDVRLALAGGDRRGGKTFDTFFCQLAALVHFPLHPDGTPSIGWAISRTYRERDELDQLIASYIPRNWYRHQRAPEHRIWFAHGSYLRNLSAEDPESLRQGRVDWLLYNEGQKMSPKAIVNGLYGTADRAGLTILAANPPSDPSQEWLSDLKEAIDEDPKFQRVSRFFNFESRLNPFVDQPARKDVAMIAEKIAPEGAEADSEGLWKRWGEFAYPRWNHRPLDKGGLVGPPPEIGTMVDITQQVTRRELGRPASIVVGGDFQRQPQAAALLRIFEGPDGPIYWFIHESQVKGDELALSASVVALGPDLEVHFPQDGLWIADCSGSFQGSERIPGRTSFGMLEQHNWFVEAAEVIRIPDKSDHPRNPLVGPRLNLMASLMDKRRIRVDPRCEILLQAFKNCQLRKTEYGKRVPKGRWAHITDAASYPVWRLETKPDGRGRVPSKKSMKSVDVRANEPKNWY